MASQLQDYKAMEQAGVSLFKKSLSQSKNPAFKKVAGLINENGTLQEAVLTAEDNLDTSTLKQNSLFGNLLIFIGEQWIETHSKDIYGDLFKLNGELKTGGVEIVLYPNNSGAYSYPNNYQTSTEAMSVQAFGPSATMANLINITATIEPFYNYMINGQMSLMPFCTLNLTKPLLFASFSSLNAQKAGELMSEWNNQLERTNKIYFYALGNMMLTEFAPKNTYTTTSNNIYDMLSKFLIPLIERFKQLSANFNAGINYVSLMTSPTDDNYFTQLTTLSSTIAKQTWVQSLPQWMTCANSASANQPYLNNRSGDKFTLYMNADTMACFLSLLQTNAIGVQAFNIETSGNLITRIGGIKVSVTGTRVVIPPQAPVGTPVIPGLDNGQVLSFGQIALIDDDYMTWYRCYDDMFETGAMVQSAVDLVRNQKAYFPIIKPWLNGIMINATASLTNTNALNVNILSNSSQK